MLSLRGPRNALLWSGAVRGHDVVKHGSFCSASVLSPHGYVVKQWMRSDRVWGGLWWHKARCSSVACARNICARQQ